MEFSDGRRLEGDEQINDGPSVVFDAFVHLQFIGYTAAAKPPLAKAGVAAASDDRWVELKRPPDAAQLVRACRKLRLRERQAHADRG